MPKTDEDLEGGRDGAASKQENDSAPKTLFGLPMKTAQVRRIIAHCAAAQCTPLLHPGVCERAAAARSRGNDSPPRAHSR